MTPRLVHCPHPLLPTAGREILTDPFREGETVAEYLARHHIHPGPESLLSVNGEPVPRAEWARRRPRSGDVITLRAAVAGGGDDNKTLRTILTIAVLVVAQQYGAAIGAALGTSAAVGTAVAYIGGMLLVNALVPPAVPGLGDAQGRAESPTYSLSGGSNRARPYAPLPVVLGRHRIFPDLGAKAYTEFLGGDQFLYQVFNFGLGDIVLSEYRIGDTLLSDFADVETQESDAAGRVTLFPTNVDAVAGGTIDIPTGWVTRTGSAGATGLAVDFAGYLFYSGDNGLERLEARIDIEYRAVGDTTWLPFDPNPDSRGNDTLISSSSRKPIRRSIRINVAEGQYEVRVRLRDIGQWVTGPLGLDDWASIPESDPRATAQLQFAQLRSYQPDTGDYTGQTRVAVKIKATGQLNGQIDRFNAIASSRVPVWNGTAWVTQETSNPAWLFLWYARGGFDASGQRVFGAGLPDSRIDIAAIQEWGAWCDSKGLTCNLVFDQPMNCRQQLAIIARCGRAAPTWSTGRLGVVWDAGNQPVVAVFGMSNIVRNTFRVDYVTERLADEVVVNFINPDLNWQPDSVRAVVPGVTNPTNPVSIDLMGCTDVVMAGKEANLIAAEQEYRRRVITWETDLEGLIVQRGDVVTLSHDLTQWGHSGRLVAGTTTVLTLDRAVPFTAGQTHYVGVRFPDGTYDIYDVVYQAGESDTITLNTPLPSAPDDDPNHPPLDYLWFFEPRPTPGKKVKITDIRPLDEHRVRITATDEDDNYYLAENNGYTHIVVTPDVQTPVITTLEISDTLINVGNSFGIQIIVTWDTTGPYQYAIVRAAPPDEPLEVVERTYDKRATFFWQQEGTIKIEVTALTAGGEYGAGGVALQTHTILGRDRDPDDVTGFQAVIENNGVVLRWNDVNAADLLDYEIRTGADWESGTLVGRVDSNEFALAWLAAGTHTWWIKARDASTPRRLSTNAASAALTVDAPGAPTLSAAFEGENMVLGITGLPGSQPIREYRISHGAAADETPVATVAADRFRAKAAWSGTRRWWVVPVDVAGNDGAAAWIDVQVDPPAVANLTRRIIDNQVALQWTGQPGTLPILEYEIRKGADLVTSELLGTKTGTFDLVMELTAGTYTYWVVPVDVAGNAGTAASVAAVVNAPADFVLREDWASSFGGTRTNAFITQDGRLLVPVDTTETWEQHFTGNSWSTPQDQIDAGYAWYAMPATATAVYEEIFDYGTLLEGTLITVTRNATTLAGAVSVTTTISVRAQATDPWTDYVGVEQVFATDFRYVKVRLDFASTGGDDLLAIEQLNVQLSVKQITDEGSGTANAADAGGTPVAFNKAFVAVEAINVTYNGNAAVTTAYELPAGPNPTQFNVYLFDSTTGARVSGPFSWSARGN